MPDETTILSLPLILPAQAQKHVTHNEALAQLDLIVQLAVINRTLTAPPASPTVGDRYIVADGATGAWTGQAGLIAFYSETGWQFTAALPGWRAHILAEGQTAVFDGLVWRTPAQGTLTVASLGVAATPDAANRIAVASPGSLFNHSGQGHQLKVNKAAVTHTASLLFQTNFSGRAEMGTMGEDSFSIKVSPDGIDWPTALSANVETAEVTFPAPVHLGGQDSDPIAPMDGMLWLNTTTGEVRLRSGGVTQTVGGAGPGGSAYAVQFNSGTGSLGGASDAQIEGGQLRLPFIAVPETPAAEGLKLYGTDFGSGCPAFKLPNGRVKLVQSDLGDFNINRFVPGPGLGNLTTAENSLSLAQTGTISASTAAPDTTNLFTLMPRVEVLVTNASASAVAAVRGSNASARLLRVGRDANAPGGFLLRCLWGPATGAATPTHRGFCGIGQHTVPTDQEPSDRINVVGMGWDADDGNIQFMHNDASGTCSKIDLGPEFPVPTVDREQVYEVQLYSPNELSQSVSYRVIRYAINDKTIAAEVSGTVAANLPLPSVLSCPLCFMSVGGTSSVIGVAVMGILTAREY